MKSSCIPTIDKRLLKLRVQGAVQGVGFRPFIFRLARELHLSGWVLNGPAGVEAEVEGPQDVLQEFLQRVRQDKPAHAVLESLSSIFGPPKGYSCFEIRPSKEEGQPTVLVMPDLALCPDCRMEILNPLNRRYHYPFTNCTHCGPRFSIIEKLPYDRLHTTMRFFTMCPDCQREYEDPMDRRFHAQPNACPKCGPQLECWNADGEIAARGEAALESALREIRLGKTIAMKGVGGFHLICDARNDTAVVELRRRKHREAKPLAVMFPDLVSIKAVCEMGQVEEALLVSAEAPIVLLFKKSPPDSALAPSLAPGNPQLGVFLPSTPLHQLLLSELGFPVVATSANLSDEPLCIQDKEALLRLKGIADFFLTHNRPIVRPVDDSVARVIFGEVQLIRRARGYAPLPVSLEEEGPAVLALGGHLKASVALAVKGQAFLSQHLGDLSTLASVMAFEKSVSDLPRLYETQPVAVACDLHPDYVSTRQAKEMRLPVVFVQHHLAHVYSCIAENQVKGKVFGVAWDGAGLGEDGTVWGGEFFSVEAGQGKRVGFLRPFPLLGGEQAEKEPRRSALGILWEMFGEAAITRADLGTLQSFTPEELRVLKKMSCASRRLMTSSAGRLFDAVASLVGLCQFSKFEGEAAMALEFAMERIDSREAYPFPVKAQGEGFQLDWEPLILELLEDVARRTPVGIVSLRFHNALVNGIASAASWLGLNQVALSGGCFQNRYLLEHSVQQLRAKGLTPYWNKQVPPNDGGLAFGQAAYARMIFKNAISAAR